MSFFIMFSNKILRLVGHSNSNHGSVELLLNSFLFVPFTFRTLCTLTHNYIITLDKLSLLLLLS
jgi:hypothetical protein